MTKLHYWKLMHTDLAIYDSTGLEEYFHYAQSSYETYKKLGGRKQIQFKDGVG